MACRGVAGEAVIDTRHRDMIAMAQAVFGKAHAAEDLLTCALYLLPGKAIRVTDVSDYEGEGAIDVGEIDTGGVAD